MGHWTWDIEHGTLDIGLKTSEIGHKTLDIQQSYKKWDKKIGQKKSDNKLTKKI